jgi:hypothetical protein
MGLSYFGDQKFFWRLVFFFKNLLDTVIREFCLNSHPAGQMSDPCRSLRSW